jgi:TonB-dependent SusC/RagA subfamily outer membrane receptor
MRKKITYAVYVALLISVITSSFCQVAFSQGTSSYTIKGKVVDDKDAPLPGASVNITGTTKGTQTDFNGAFSLTLEGPANLTVSFIGFLPKQVSVTSATKTITIALAENGKQLNEVVVVGYGTQKKSDITGAVASVPKARLEELPVTNVLQALEGAVAGVNITTTSSIPGKVPASSIRGQNSIYASSDPFIVVDGIPLSKSGGSLNDINPNDVESMEVLKDASATAIYGTNGSNGVILITTKRGGTGKPVISYGGYVGPKTWDIYCNPATLHHTPRNTWIT